jgi:hypothetical protein
MSAILASLIPTFLIIATGWLCRATNFVSEQHWAGLERVTYVIFFRLSSSTPCPAPTFLPCPSSASAAR